MFRFRNIRRKPLNVSTLNTNSPHIKNNRSDTKIIIIGAGLAGLSAANHLIKNGFKQTVVLEATNRYGGRINSIHFGDAFCELGAKWVALDASKNSMYELVQQSTGLQKKIKEKCEIIYVKTHGGSISKKQPDLVDAIFRNLCGNIKLEEKYKSGDLNDLNNVQSYFNAETNKVIKDLFKEEDREIVSQIFHSLIKDFGSLLGCCLEYVNIEHITNFKNYNVSGIPNIYIPTGLNSSLEEITQNIAPDHLMMAKPIGEIKWHGSSKLEPRIVSTLDGSVFSADHIICTLPLGVLKTFSDYMFQPRLPKEKLKAIENIGFGSPVRIFFEYEGATHEWFLANIRPLWSTREYRKERKWTKQVVEIARPPRSNRVLEIVIGGEFYDEIERLPDNEVISEITKLLRTCLKNKGIPYPCGMLRSTWSSSACYFGGRPYFSTASTGNDIKALAAPLGEGPNLLFAGDATILKGFGTVDGARASGIREAQRIIELYQKLP